MTAVWTDDFFATVRTQEYTVDPYPSFRVVRDTAAAVPTDSDIWLVSRYADVVKGLKDPALSADLTRLDSYRRYFRTRGIDDRFPMPLNALDPPDHRRIRSAIAPEFRPASVDRLRPVVEATVRQVLDDLDRGGATRIDLVAEVAYPVPIAIIANLFGIPDDDRPMLQRWSSVFGSASDPDLLLTDEQRTDAAEATREAGAYFARLVADRKRAARAELVVGLLGAMRGDTPISLAELLVNGVFLLIVGHHNTVSLIANGMLALLSDPGQLAALRAEPALLANAVDELLRYDSPVQTATRVTAAEYHVDGVAIPPGRQVTLLLGSANRDERAFADPDRLDIARPDAARHVGLGRGAHTCLGGLLARVEAAATIGALVARYPRLALDGPAGRRVPGFSLRGLTSLPVRLN